MNITDFYEQYWKKSNGTDPEGRQLVNQRKKILSAVLKNLPSEKTILDLGCGHGVFSNFFYQLGFNVTGVDISQTAIKCAKQLYPVIQFQTALADKLPFKDQSFDVIWCTEVIEHLFDIRAALEEMNRVLKIGGKLILTTPYHGLIKNLLIATVGFDKHYDPYGAHIRFLTRHSLKRCLNDVDFKIKKWTGIGRCWPVWMSHFVMTQKMS